MLVYVCACVCLYVCVQTHIVTQMVKNLTAMQETRVQSLGQEDPLEKGIATHSSILNRGVWQAPIHGVAKSQTRLSD